MPKIAAKVSITFGDGVAVIRREGVTTAIVAKVLGRELQGGRDVVYLDRLIHDDEQDWQEWTASGAISTILARLQPAGASQGA